MILLTLFWEFFKVGLFAVGGGLATLPFLSSLGARTGWFTSGQLADMVAVSESTPGPIGVNMATYVGFTTAGVPGAVVATLGLIAPSIIIILIIAGFLDKFRSNRQVDNAFYGIRPASTALITAALIGLMAVSLFGTSTAGLLHITSIDIKPLILFAVLMAVTNIKKVKDLHPIVFIAASAVIGIIFHFAE
ncbi:MAG: chromate transporter [Firmicutes bacterium]|nr:chromate transporter [Bacillota bacterium]MBR5731380.1 chromate transporter [Bacillota bacterium]